MMCYPPPQNIIAWLMPLGRMIKKWDKVGWSLYSREGIRKLQGSSSINPTNSPLEAEAIALSMAVQQMKNLCYDQVTFISDCKLLIDGLHHQFYTEESITKRCITKTFSLIHDFHEMSKSCSFNFWYQVKSHLQMLMY